MNNLLSLKNEISQTTDSIDPDDVVDVKNSLNKFGYYEVPSYGLTPYGDTPMIDGIKKYQKDHNLTVDGIMKPGGETEASLNKKLSSLSSPQQPETPTTNQPSENWLKRKNLFKQASGLLFSTPAQPHPNPQPKVITDYLDKKMETIIKANAPTLKSHIEAQKQASLTKSIDSVIDKSDAVNDEYKQYFGNGGNKFTRADRSNLASSICENILKRFNKQNLSSFNIDQIKGTVYDYCNNYIDMLNSNTVGADSYFHCKGNFDAARRGETGEKSAEVIGNVKEFNDYVINRLFKGKNYPEAFADYNHDLYNNKLGREQASKMINKGSKEGCDFLRPKGLNKNH